MSKPLLNKMLMLLVALAAGTLLGGVFVHLLPEALEVMQTDSVFGLMLVAFIVFFLVEKILRWRHCHDAECDEHTFGYMNLIGDSIHNYIDGLVIAAAFYTNASLGIATTLAMAMHEIPQEIGDFAVLVHAGMGRKKALLLNLATALTAVLGAVTGFVLIDQVGMLSTWLLPVAAGGFLYISAADLLPEIRKEHNLTKSLFSVLVFTFGIGLMYLLKD